MITNLYSISSKLKDIFNSIAEFKTTKDYSILNRDLKTKLKTISLYSNYFCEETKSLINISTPETSVDASAPNIINDRGPTEGDFHYNLKHEFATIFREQGYVVDVEQRVETSDRKPDVVIHKLAKNDKGEILDVGLEIQVSEDSIENIEKKLQKSREFGMPILYIFIYNENVDYNRIILSEMLRKTSGIYRGRIHFYREGYGLNLFVGAKERIIVGYNDKEETDPRYDRNYYKLVFNKDTQNLITDFKVDYKEESYNGKENIYLLYVSKCRTFWNTKKNEPKNNTPPEEGGEDWVFGESIPPTPPIPPQSTVINIDSGNPFQ